VSDTEEPIFEALLLDVNAVIAQLPLEEREEYERCQQSVVDARRHAVQHEGQLWIV
jgi:CYTH domain-containing protein